MLTYALIGTNQQKLDHVVTSIKEIAGQNINKLFTVYGEYDLVLKLKSKHSEEARETLQQIKDLNGVISMQSGVVVHQTHSKDTKPNIESL
jgi:nitrate reductase NapAB chaperone NapD